MPSALPDAFSAYSGVSVPVIVTDGGFAIVYLNSRAEAYWDTTLEAVKGQRVDLALGLAPPQGQDAVEWSNAVLYPAFVSGDPFVSEATLGGQRRTLRFAGTRALHGGQWYCVMTLEPEVERRATGDIPGWALRDPLTGLFNRHQWQNEFATRDQSGGAVVFFDLDDLKGMNDLAGHDRGDQALVAIAKVIEANAPPGALVIRYGGDEFVAALTEGQRGQADAFARRVQSQAAGAGQAQHLPQPLRVGYGIAPFEAGGLEAAMGAADEDLYVRKGRLLRGALGGRIIVHSRTAGPRLMVPGGPVSGTGPGAFATGFGPEFDGYFRQMFARANDQAREFVDFVQPEAGAAVVEVGAGTGRISFDGGLADRIGASGQLLITDASDAQLQICRQRAHALGLSWVRFLAAPVEELPLASDTADLVLGSTFLHFTNAPAAIGAMARIVRPGGKVALSALLPEVYGPAVTAAMEPIVALLRRKGLTYRSLGLPREEIESLFVRAGLQIEAAVVSGTESIQFPSPAIALGVVRQARIVAMALRDVPEADLEGVQEDVDRRFTEAVARMGIRAADAALPMLSLVARKAG